MVKDKCWQTWEYEATVSENVFNEYFVVVY